MRSSRDLLSLPCAMRSSTPLAVRPLAQSLTKRFRDFVPSRFAKLCETSLSRSRVQRATGGIRRRCKLRPESISVGSVGSFCFVRCNHRTCCTKNFSSQVEPCSLSLSRRKEKRERSPREFSREMYVRIFGVRRETVEGKRCKNSCPLTAFGLVNLLPPSLFVARSR